MDALERLCASRFEARKYLHWPGKESQHNFLNWFRSRQKIQVSQNWQTYSIQGRQGNRWHTEISLSQWTLGKWTLKERRSWSPWNYSCLLFKRRESSLGSWFARWYGYWSKRPKCVLVINRAWKRARNVGAASFAEKDGHNSWWIVWRLSVPIQKVHGICAWTLFWREAELQVNEGALWVAVQRVGVLGGRAVGLDLAQTKVVGQTGQRRRNWKKKEVVGQYSHEQKAGQQAGHHWGGTTQNARRRRGKGKGWRS